MATATSPELLRFLSCPDCCGDLSEVRNVLKCSDCGREYEVRSGIPLLYPEKMDLEHLQEEQALARMMKQPRVSRKERFSSLQWENSKREFWDMVRKHVKPPPKSLVNIGCGYDASFREFQGDGYAFVNFDLVYDMLHDLRETHGAAYCVAGDLNRLPFKRNSFDYVTSVDVIHHESNKLSGVLESFATLLKPEGSLFLEDLNAWGLYQCPKSLLLPKPVHRLLRSMYHNLRGSSHKPAEYEFPTSLRRVKRILDELGFLSIVVHANRAYPNIGPLSFRIYELFSEIEWFRKYRNYHYMLSATRRLA